MNINEFGYDVASSIEDFFQKISYLKKTDKPSEKCVQTARKIVTMMVEKPISLFIHEKTIIIDYNFCNFEVEDNKVEFLYLPSGKNNL